MKITVLCEKESWCQLYVQDLLRELVDHEVQLIDHHKDIQRGDLLVMLSYGRILKSDDLQKNTHNILSHSSDLPKGKGWSPVHWEVESGSNEITSSLIEADLKVDSGAVYAKKITYLEGHELLDEIRHKVMKTDIDLIVDFVKNSPEGKPQEGEESFYPKRGPKDNELDTAKSIAEQFNKMRVSDNESYPLHFTHNGHKYVLKVYKDDSPQ